MKLTICVDLETCRGIVIDKGKKFYLHLDFLKVGSFYSLIEHCVMKRP
jgi:hypothetical protein